MSGPLLTLYERPIAHPVLFLTIFSPRYMRLLTSAHLKSNAEHFANFLDSDFSDIADFCAREVEPSGKECEQIQVIALADALGCRVSVVYLDGHNEEGKFNEHHFGPKEAAISISMLYRPGHYDLLEK